MTSLRHIAIRIWITIFFWLLAIICFLPPLQAIIGINWLFIPALLLFGGTYFAAGAIMDRLASVRLERLLEEESTYEHAGMAKEAENAINDAVALFDSFLLSGNVRETFYEKLLVKAAWHRFGSGGAQIALDRWVIAYLEHFPKDSEAARIWLQAAMKLDQISPKHFDLITQLYRNQPDNAGLQHLLGRVFLAERRIDFEALQLYRRILEHDNFSDENFLGDLAHLLAAKGMADEWAFDIYLKAYEKYPDSPDILHGILACVREIGGHERNRSLLLRARDLLSQNSYNQADSAEIEQTLRTLQATKRVNPTEYEETLIPTQASATKMFSGEQRPRPLKPFFMQVIEAAIRKKKRFQLNASAWFERGRKAGMLRWVALACICGGILFFVVNIIAMLLDGREIAENPPPPKEVAEADPFTLQVAAYLSQNDAEKYVEKLKQQNLNAYLTEAQGRDRKWYQVRIAHFADPKEAKQYGETLKSKGIINDYYVANYKPPLKH